MVNWRVNFPNLPEWALDGMRVAEFRTVEYLLRGMTNRAIAKAMRTNEQVVKNRLTRVYKLHGVRTRTELMAKCLGGRDDVL